MRPLFLLSLVILTSACQSTNDASDTSAVGVPVAGSSAQSVGSNSPINPMALAGTQAGKMAQNGSTGGVRTSGGDSAGLSASGGKGGSSTAGNGSRPSADAGVGSAAGGAAPGSVDAGKDAGAVQPDNTPRKPVFKKTSCIDPNVIQGETETSFPCDGVDIWVSVPEQCRARACGLIFNIHGGGMADHTWMPDATDMIALGKANDYVVVHPHKGTWSVSNDRAAVFALMEQAIEAFDVDRKRIHSTGYSQGGQLSWALACEHADVIASVAPAEEINRVTDCWKTAKRPAREIPVLFAYGKQDSIGGGYTAAQTAVSDFVKSYAMTGPQTIAGADGTNYHRQRWVSASGNVIEFISHNYTSGLLAGHCLPLKGGTTMVNCTEPVDYNWGEEAMLFFKAHPMP
jgi:hypothetical protein